MLITFFLSLFGLLTAARTVQFLISNQIISKVQQKVSLVASIFIYFIMQICMREHDIVLWMITCCVFSAPFLIFQGQEYQRRQNFQKNIINYLDSLIIRIRSGVSLKQAIQELGKLQKGSSRFYFNEIASAMEFRLETGHSIKDPLFLEVLLELQQVCCNSYKSVERLRGFRRKIKMRQDFRQKSRQAALQVRAQASILILIYLALLVFVLSSNDFPSVRRTIFVSLCLFIFGLLVSYRVSRGFKWKI